VGIEPDESAVQKGRALYGVEILQGTPERISFPEDHFDAVVMRHVLEHVPDPVELLRRCFRWLKPGGLLALATPNGGSLASRWFGRHWRGLTPPWHIHIFNPRSLRLLLVRSGFMNVRVRTTPVSAHWVYTASRWIREGRYDASTQVPSSWWFHILEAALNLLVGTVGEEMEGLAQKPCPS
jgi:SAM-dependent methyltransferase